MVQVFDLEPHFKVHINAETGEVKVFSFSPRLHGRELKCFLHHKGYLAYTINRKFWNVHTLVTNFFLGDRPKGMVVNHKDGVKTNNRLSNLEYVTQLENIRHAMTLPSHDPSRSPRYKGGIYKKDPVAYKREWYLKNKEALNLKMRENYYAKTTNKRRIFKTERKYNFPL